MRSIKTKISALTLLCVIISSFLIGGISIQSSKNVVAENSEQTLKLLCSNKAEVINALLSRIEQSVFTLHEYATSQIDDIGQFKTDADYVKAYSDKIETIALNAANNTEGAMTVYIRYNPEFTEPTSGIFYTRDSADSAFQRLVPTDFSMYDKDDFAHVGWYYIPINNGKATWLDPYVNENINVKMISYVIPITIGNTSVGIVGMDIDFGVIQKIVEETSAYKTGYAFLADSNGNALLHPDFEMNSPFAENENDALYKMMADLKSGNGEQLLSYNYNGDNKKMTFAILNNGMRFAVAAPISEIDNEANHLIIKISVIVIGAVLVSLIISMIVIQGIVKPIKELNTAAAKIADGKLDVSVSSHSRDEVGTLAESFRKTVDRLNTYIVYIDEIASVLAQIANGNLQIDLEQDYEGEFSRIKDAIQIISETLSRDIYNIRIAAEQVSDGADQVSDGAQVLSDGASEQNRSVSKLSDYMRQMLKHAEENTERAKEASRIVNTAGINLEDSRTQMQSMVKAMQEISANADGIAQIVNTINDISMQTNILAINASIEAANAGGEAGKGFSVVANQVKDLALKSMESTENISRLVNDAVSSIRNGKEIAVLAESNIKGTVDEAKKTVEIVDNIVKSSEMQSETAEHVEESVEMISSVVQKNTSTSQESAAASEELSAQAQMLKELVSKFNLKKDIS